MSDQRIVVWVSAGLASAAAWKLSTNQYGSRAMGVYCDTSKTEDEGNIEFLHKVSKWVGNSLTVIRSEKYSTIDDVFEHRRFLAGIRGAPCTTEMKKIPRFKFQEADDIHIFGMCVEETMPLCKDPRRDRIAELESKNPDMLFNHILRDNNITKSVCRQLVLSAGIPLPIRYQQGFENNNCKACVKASSLEYWVLTRRHNPVEFYRRADQGRRFGSRPVRYRGKRIFLDELPPDDQIIFRGKPLVITKSTENLSCGPECK